MQLSVRLFARARDLAGSGQIDVEVPPDATVGELRSALCARIPALGPLAGHLFVAVNNDYAADSTVLRPDDEVACFPPVSGG